MLQKTDTSNNTNTNTTITINGQDITKVGKHCQEKSITFLGIHVDEHLTWNSHINFVYNKMSRIIFAMNMTKHILPSSALCTLYHALIESIVRYGIVIWGNGVSFTKIKKKQKQVLRIIFRKGYRAHTDPLFKQSHILKSKDLYNLCMAILGHNYKWNSLPMSFSNLYPPDKMILQPVKSIIYLHTGPEPPFHHLQYSR
jgi:hypothetical protein